MGSWVVYGLGSESENLPAFIVMLDGGIKEGSPAYGSGFLPAMYQGTVLRTDGSPILNVNRPREISAEDQRRMLDLLDSYNRAAIAAARPDDSDLAARMASYELAFKMQTSVPDLADLSRESEATRKLYGIDDAGDRRVRNAMPDGPPHGRARRPVSSSCIRAETKAARSVGMGTANATRTTSSWRAASTNRSQGCWPI